MKRNRTTVFSNATASDDRNQRARDRCDKINPEICHMLRDYGRAKERAGFIDAPEIGPAKSASSAMTDPTAIPAVIPRSLAPTETLRITNVNRAVRMISRINDCSAGPAGAVAPKVACCGNKPRKSKLATSAPD